MSKYHADQERKLERLNEIALHDTTVNALMNIYKAGDVSFEYVLISMVEVLYHEKKRIHEQLMKYAHRYGVMDE
ncbi:hypothetical protein LOZ80_26005 [Paenibacillus sp. HWE-109]|uniref:hypothetical protein n=1 Tax=Paenibacillus sp. HWE-109 TaxID=1306526 RepID=UPI001EDED30A|nr:hypothetical protein [Paenibacillus sp. HWE-109]UKS25035.1 hypothetical protein LOZ80_26005 [Paenibacillus sp. HWE-109]